MTTYIVVFDLGIFSMNYSAEKGYSVSTNDHFTEYDFREISNILDYIKLENFTEKSALEIHNDNVVESYLEEYVAYLNRAIKNYHGKVVPLFRNCFGINYDGSAEELLELVTYSNKHRFVRAFVLPLETFTSNLNRESLLQLEYLKQQVRK